MRFTSCHLFKITALEVKSNKLVFTEVLPITASCIAFWQLSQSVLVKPSELIRLQRYVGLVI